MYQTSFIDIILEENESRKMMMDWMLNNYVTIV